MDEAYALMRQLDSEIATARDNADKKKKDEKKGHASSLHASLSYSVLIALLAISLF